MFNKKLAIKLLFTLLILGFLEDKNVVLAQTKDSGAMPIRYTSADLKIIEVKVSPEKPTINDKIKLIVTIKNDGYKDAKNFVITAEDEKGWKAKDVKVKSLKIGEIKTVNLAMLKYDKDWLIKYNPHNFEIYVDSTNKVKEKLESNNFAAYSLIVEAPINSSDYQKVQSGILSLELPSDWKIRSNATPTESWVAHVQAESSDYQSHIFDQKIITDQGALFVADINKIPENQISTYSLPTTQKTTSLEKKPITLNNVEGTYYTYSKEGYPDNTNLQVIIFAPIEGSSADNDQAMYYEYEFRFTYNQTTYLDGEQVFDNILKTIQWTNP